MNPQMQAPTVDNHEGQMARADLYRAAKNAMKLFQMIEESQELEGWVQAKLTKAADYIDSVYHYMEYQAKFGDGTVATSIDDITGEATVEKEDPISEEDDEVEMKESYNQKLQSLLEGAIKKAKSRKMSEAAKKKGKPDFLDIDGDDDTKEPMKKAAADKKAAGGKTPAKAADQKGLSAKQKKLPPGLQKAIAKKKPVKESDDVVESIPANYKTAALKAAASKDRDADEKSGVPANYKTAAIKADLAKDSKVKEGFPTVAGAREKAEKEKTTGKFDKKELKPGVTQYTRKSSTFDDGGKDSDQKKAEKKPKKESVSESSDLDRLLKLAGRRPLVG